MVHLNWTVGNYGLGTTYSGAWYDRIVLSTNDRYGDSDDVELGRVRYVGTLEENNEYTAAADVQLPKGLSGDYHLFVHTDADNRLFEYLLENNNVREAPSPISVTLTPYADLRADSVSAPAEARTADPVTITWSASNQGGGTTGDGTPGGTVASWTDRIVFSRNTIFGDADDRLVAEVPHTGALTSGEPYSGSWTGELPGNLSGEYQVFVQVDSTNAVYEYDDAQPNVVRGVDPILVHQWIVEPGTLTEDTVWDGLIKVLGTVTVPAGKTLTIMPGSIVKFASGTLEVYGRLDALGQVGNPIILTSLKDDTAGGDTNDDGANDPRRGGLGGDLVLQPGSSQYPERIRDSLRPRRHLHRILVHRPSREDSSLPRYPPVQ